MGVTEKYLFRSASFSMILSAAVTTYCSKKNIFTRLLSFFFFLLLTRRILPTIYDTVYIATYTPSEYNILHLRNHVLEK